MLANRSRPARRKWLTANPKHQAYEAGFIRSSLGRRELDSTVKRLPLIAGRRSFCPFIRSPVIFSLENMAVAESADRLIIGPRGASSRKVYVETVRDRPISIWE